MPNNSLPPPGQVWICHLLVHGQYSIVVLLADYSIFTTRKQSLGQGNLSQLFVCPQGEGIGFPGCITGHMTRREEVCNQGEGVYIRGDLHLGAGV